MWWYIINSPDVRPDSSTGYTLTRRLVDKEFYFDKDYEFYNEAISWSRHSYSYKRVGTDLALYWRDKIEIGECFHYLTTYTGFVGGFREVLRGWNRRQTDNGQYAPRYGNLNDVVTYLQDFTRLHICKRISKTEYIEILVQNLASASFVSAMIGGVEHTKIANYPLGDDAFVIPVSAYIVRKMRGKDVISLMQHATRLDFYAADVVHLRFYQTEEFGDFLRVVGAVIAIILWWTGSAAWYEILIELAVAMLMPELLSIVFKIVYKVTGSKDVAFAVTAVLAIVAGGYGAESFTDAWHLVAIATNFAQAVTVGYAALNKEQMEKIETMEEEYARKQRELDEVDRTNDITGYGEYLAHLNSVSTNIHLAIEAQYSYDMAYNYDSLVSNFCENKLKIGVV